MTSPDAEQIGIIEKFKTLPWHDAKFLALSLARIADGNDLVEISVAFPSSTDWAAPRALSFIDVTYMKINIDLEGKRVCSDSISSASCSKSSDWLHSLAKNTHDDFGGYLHFRIALIPPGGSVDVLAKGFVYRDNADGGNLEGRVP